MKGLLTRLAFWLLRSSNPHKDEGLAGRLWELSCEFRREPMRWACFEAACPVDQHPDRPWVVVQLGGPIPPGFEPATIELRKKGDDTRGVVP
jgi:hypothetical protein